MKMFELGKEGRKELGQKAKSYVKSDFHLDKTISEWDRTLTDLVENWEKDRKSIYKPWRIKEISGK